jgi:hypothetical protein
VDENGKQDKGEDESRSASWVFDGEFCDDIRRQFCTGLWLRQKWRKSYTHFVVTYGLICLHAALHAFFIATIYFLDQLLRVLLPGFLARPIITAIGEATYPVAILQRVIGRLLGCAVCKVSA